MSNNLNCSNCVVNFHKILRSWLGDIEDCSAFMDQIQFLFLLCVCSISNSSLSKAPTLYLHGMVGGYFIFYFLSLFSPEYCFLYLSSSNCFLSTLLFLEQHVFSLPCSTQNHLENMFLPQIHFTTC